MNICFYAAGPKSGLACNGGSRTILKSAEVLRGLGHTVSVCARRDLFTWFDHPKPTRDPDPDRDVLVAVSARDVKNACKLRGPVVWWMRGIETWQMPEDKLIERAKMVDKMIVNASHLQGWLAERGVNSDVCFAGMDFDVFVDRGGARNEVCGGLVNKTHDTKHSDLVKRVASWWKYGDFVEQAMVGMYNGCRIWFAPTELEGFHNVPAEANLCGCLVVCSRHPHNGMSDYATDDTAMRYDTFEEVVECIRNPDYGKVSLMQKVLRKQIGSREKNMRRFVSLLSQL